MAVRKPTPALPDDLVEEILLRLVPDEPALLMRAALACRQWCRLVSDPGFCRRFLARHGRRRPPLLGTVRNSNRGDVVRFTPVCSIRPPRAERRGWWALDSRHGLVLLIQSSPRSSRFDVGRALAIWDPVADKLRQLPVLSGAPPQLTEWSSFNATVVCAATGSADCDHIDCPFLVVFLGSDHREGKLFAYLYSSIADAWSEPTTYAPAPYSGSGTRIHEQKLVPHLGNSVYFLLMFAPRILEYNLVTRELTLIHTPSTSTRHSSLVLSAAEGGRLGCVMIAGYTLRLWSREAAGPNGEMRWVQSRVIQMKPGNPLLTRIPNSVCYTEGSGLVYNGSECGFFATGLKLGLNRLLELTRTRDNIVPYMSFYIPALAGPLRADDPIDDGASIECM